MAIACLSLDLSAVRYRPLRVLLPCRLASAYWSRVCTGVPTGRQPQPAAACPCRPPATGKSRPRARALYSAAPPPPYCPTPSVPVPAASKQRARGGRPDWGIGGLLL